MYRISLKHGLRIASITVKGHLAWLVWFLWLAYFSQPQLTFFCVLEKEHFRSTGFSAFGAWASGRWIFRDPLQFTMVVPRFSNSRMCHVPPSRWCKVVLYCVVWTIDIAWHPIHSIQSQPLAFVTFCPQDCGKWASTMFMVTLRQDESR